MGPGRSPPATFRNVGRCVRLARKMLRHPPGDGVQHRLGDGPRLAFAFWPRPAFPLTTWRAPPGRRAVADGRLLGRVPPVNVSHPAPSAGRTAGGPTPVSVFDGFVAVPRRRSRPDRQVVVTVGRGPPVRSDAAAGGGGHPGGAEVLWQVGSSDVSGIGIDARRTVPADELAAAIGGADVVIAHAGTGRAGRPRGRALPGADHPGPGFRRARRRPPGADRQISAGLGLAVSRRVEDLIPRTCGRPRAAGSWRRDPGPLFWPDDADRAEGSVVRVQASAGRGYVEAATSRVCSCRTRPCRTRRG